MTTVTIQRVDVSVTETLAVLTVASGATSFLGLVDTPDAYTGQGGKVVSVKSDVTGLEFTTGGGAGVTDGDKGDVVVSGSGGNLDV